MDDRLAGWGSGLIGVLIFSGSLPATRLAVLDFDPMFLTAARGVIAATLAGLCLLALKQPLPRRQDLVGLALSALCVVVGFPLLTALALQQVSAAHSIVFIGLLPLSTAIFGVVRGGERPKPAFWLFSCLGAASIAGFALMQGGSGTLAGGVLMCAAIVVCGFGYAEGARLSRHLGGWQVISWAVVLAAPLMGVLAIVLRPEGFGDITLSGWIGLGYVGVFSMLIGFFFWYRGLAKGGIAGVGQLQLLQPFFGLLLAGLILQEPVSGAMVLASVAVVACVAGAKRFA